MSAPRVLIVGGPPLTDEARQVLGSSDVSLEVAGDLAAGEALLARPFRPDLVVLDTRVLAPGQPLEEGIAACTRTFGAAILGVGDRRPPPEALRRVAAYLVEPYTQSELVTAFAELLGTHPRRSNRRGVKLGTRLHREDGRVWPVTTLQLSSNGCLIEADSQLSLGAEVELEFVLPSNGERIVIDGVVVSSNELQLLYGVRFGEERASERLAIQVFVELGAATGVPATPGGGPRRGGVAR